MTENKSTSQKEIVKKEEVKEKENSNSSESIKSEIPPEILESIKDIPEDKKEKVISVLRSESFGFMGTMPHPFTDKITSAHINKMIDNSLQEDGRDRKERNHIRFFQAGFLIVGLIFVLVMVYLFRDKPEYVTNIIIGALAFASGIATGKSMKSKN